MEKKAQRQFKNFRKCSSLGAPVCSMFSSCTIALLTVTKSNVFAA